MCPYDTDAFADKRQGSKNYFKFPSFTTKLWARNENAQNVHCDLDLRLAV